MTFQLDQGLLMLRSQQLFNEDESVMELLRGPIDGATRTFFTPNAPLVYDPLGNFGPPADLIVYDADENVIPDDAYTVTSTRKGAIQFAVAPTYGGTYPAPYKVSYSYADLDLATLWAALKEGVGEMETRFYRGWQLVPVASTTTPSPAYALDLAVVDQNGNDPVGPNNVPFSGSLIQLEFLLICTCYRLARNYLQGASRSAYRMREGRMGMEIDPTQALKSQKDHLVEIAAEIDRISDVARLEWQALGVGGALWDLSSLDYQTMFDWQQAASYNGGYGGMYGGLVF